MKRTTYLFPALPALALLVGCAGEPAERPETMTAAAAVVEIPVTTASEEALTIFKQGEHALDMGRMVEARELFRQAVAKDPTFTHAYIGLLDAPGSAETFMKNLELAEANMATASDGERLLVQINRTYVDVDVAKRLDLAQQLVRAYPNSPRARLRLADIQSGLNNIADARATLNKALALDPNFAPTHISLGLSYLFTEPKDFAEAETHMKKVVELEPREASAHVNLGDAYRAQSKLEMARDAYAKGAEIDPTSALALSKKGHANSFLGNYDEARTDYARATELAKDQFKVTNANFKAFVHAYAGNPKAALDELERVYESIDGMSIPKDQVLGSKINVLTAQARIALHHNMLDIAKRTLDSRAKHVRANAAVVGDEDFTRSQLADITWREGELAARKGDYQTAQAKADELARLIEPQTDPRKMEGHHQLMGLMHLLQGKNQEAVDHFRQANKDNPYVKYHLALALEGTGNTAEARKLFREVANWNFNNAAYACIRNDAMARLKSAQA